MKMKNVFSLRNLSIAVVAGLVMAACSKKDDNPLSSTDSQNVNSESVADASTSEVADMGNSITVNVTQTQYGGRVSGSPLVLTGLDKKDGRLAGATITLTPGANSTKDNPNGTITIDFGAGVTTNGVTRKGKIVITYSGKKSVANSYRTMTFIDYSRNGVVFDNAMSYKVTNVLDSTKFHHVLTGGKLTFPNDNTTILRATDYIVTIDYTAKTVTLSATDGTTIQNTIGHSAKGTTRAGKEYSMDITTPVVYKAECLTTTVLPVQGVKAFTAGLISYTVDYGTGACDNTITITFGGKSVTVTASTDGH